GPARTPCSPPRRYPPGIGSVPRGAVPAFESPAPVAAPPGHGRISEPPPAWLSVLPGPAARAPVWGPHSFEAQSREYHRSAGDSSRSEERRAERLGEEGE